MSRRGIAGNGNTDAEGNFVSGPVWPDLQYSLRVTAEGYAKAESPTKLIKGLETVEFKPIVLAETKVVSASGVITDSNKKPLEGVTVYAAGKSYDLARTTTNSSGKFELNDLASDVRYIFTDLKGYRFSGARVSVRPIEVTLRKLDEAPKGIRPSRESDREIQSETAKGLLKLAWRLTTDQRNELRIAILEAMAKIDEPEAKEMSIQAGPKLVARLNEIKAEQLFESDPEQAIELLRLLRKWTAIYRSIEFAKRLAESDSDNAQASAKIFLEFAHELAKDNSKYFPQLATVHTLLGEHDEAKKLIEAVTSKLDVDAVTENQLGQATNLAISLAPYDFEKAQAYAKATGSAYSKTEALANVALAILQTDREKSLAEIEKLSGDNNAPNIRDRARYRAAYLLIEEDLDLAIKLVYECEESVNRAQALGRLAVEVAKTDQSKAWKMIDDAMAIYRGNSDVARSWVNYGGAGPFVAAIAYQAKSIGYPDMEGVVWQVVAACRANGVKGQQRMSATIATARLLALVDKLAARDLLGSIAGGTDQIPGENGSLFLYGQWLQAWLVIHFGKGTGLIREELEDLKEAGKEDPLRRGYGDVFGLLVAAPEDRFKLLMDDTGLWRLKVDGTAER